MKSSESRITTYKVLFALISITVCTFGMAETKCMKYGDGFGCIVSTKDSANDFKVTLSNIYADDIRFNLVKKVGPCMKLGGPPPKGPIKIADTLVPKKANLTIILDKITAAELCSFAKIDNCRPSNNVRMDCTKLVRVV